MENSEKINTCKMILSLITNGFIIDDKQVPGLSDLSDIDNKMLYIAVAMFCANNNVTITNDGDIDILPIMSGGGEDDELIKSIANYNYNIAPATMSVKPKNSKLMLYKFIFMITFILNLALGLRVMFYLYENTVHEKMTIMSNSGERLVTLVKNYPSEGLILDYEHVLKLMNEYNSLTKVDEQSSTDIVATGFAENIYEQYNKLQSLKMTRQLQLENIPELKNPDTISLDGLISPIGGILNIYRSGMKHIFELRESKLEELLYNNEIYQKVQTEYQNTREITEEMQQNYKNFMETIKKDTNQLQQKIKQPVIETLTDSLSGLVSGFFSKQPSTIDVARSKSVLLTEIITVWSRIMVNAPIETSNVMSAVTIFAANISNMTGLIQEQVYISAAIYGFFQFIVFLIYTKMIEKKITVNDFNQIAKEIEPIVQESVDEYFDKHYLDKSEALEVLTDIFIQKFYEKIVNPESGLINYETNVTETIKKNKEDIKKYILSSIDKIVSEHSRNDILFNMFDVIKGQNNIFGEKELANINKLLSIIFKEETDYDMIDTQLRIEDVRGGKKSNTNRKTKKHKKTKRTKRNKRSRMNKRTRRHKLTKRSKK